MASDNIYWLSKSLDNSGNASPDASANFIYLGNLAETETISNLNNKTTTGVQVDPIPLGGSSGAIGITYVGPVREIKIEGYFIRNTLADLNSLISFIEGLLNGSQLDSSGNMGYHLRLGIRDTVYRIVITDFTWDYKEANPTVIDYSLSMKEIRLI